MAFSSDLYNSVTNQHGYIALIYAVCGFFLIAAPVYIYMLLKVLPKQMTTYRYLLTSCGISTVILGIMRALWVPIPTVPLMGVYSAGIIANFGPMANLICLNIYFLSLVNMQLCICFCLIFQFSALQPFSWISYFGYCPKRVILCYASYFVGMSAIITFLLHYSVVDRNEFMDYAIRTNNSYAIELITKQPSWIGFSSAIKPSVIAFGILVTVPDICVASFSIILTVRIYFIIETGKSTVSTTTYNLEKNLYRTFLFRTISLVGLFTIPYMGIGLSILFEIQNPKIGIVLHFLIILQGFICMSGTVLLVKPFRNFIFGCFKNQKIGDSSEPNSSNSAQTPTTLTANSKTLPPLRTKY